MSSQPELPAGEPSASTFNLTYNDVVAAAKRIEGKLHQTPLMESALLNKMLGHRIMFKCENMQRTGAFKARGALNSVLSLLEKEEKPKHIVAYSSGNHAQAVAWACQEAKISCTIFMPNNVSKLKAQATAAYGAKVVLAESRFEAERLSKEAMEQGARLIPPFDYDAVICGQGTACLEALTELKTKHNTHADAVFTPVGGGGLLSGTYLASRHPDFQHPKVFGAEPLAGNDAVQSLKAGKVVGFSEQPRTLADGAMTMSVSQRTFSYLQRVNKVYEVSEAQLVYWTQWITHLLKVTVEPTGVLGLAAAVTWLHTQLPGRTVVVVISGGNMSLQTRSQVWSPERDHLSRLPSFEVNEELRGQPNPHATPDVTVQ